MTTKNAKSLFKIATILLLLFAISNESYSQRSRTKVEENYYQEDSTDLEHPYKKVIGISPMIGTNTVVETYYDIDPTKPNSDKDISREGIFAYGASASYFLFDFLNIEFNYMYSKDMKIVETFKGTIDPNIYQIAEITTHWIPNPYNVINYFGTLGGTFFHTSINKVPTTNFGINFGVGFLINFNFDQYGILALQAEWRLDYGLTKAKSPYIEIKDGQTVITEKERTVYYSIPRFGLFWYPKF
jgi:hypothetical protein